MYRLYYFLQTDLICLIVLTLILITIIKKSIINNSLLMFKKTLVFCMLFCLLDFIIYGLQGSTLSFIHNTLLISNTIYFALILLIGLYWNKFVNTKILYKESRGYKHFSEYFGLTLGSILLIINIFKKSIFYITSDNLFQSNSYMTLFLIICWGSIAISVIKLISHYFKTISIAEKKESLTMMLFIIAPFICNIVQLNNNNLSLTQVGLTISMLLIYLDYQQRLIKLDTLTGIYNRNFLNEYVDNLYKDSNNNTTISLFVIDIDKFKTINDTYGHDKGDEVLKEVARILKSTCNIVNKKLKLARFGGDEFIIIGNINEQDSKLLVKEINKNMKNINLESKIKLSVSIGYVTNKKIKDHSFKDLLALSDSKMYSNKKSKK